MGLHRNPRMQGACILLCDLIYDDCPVLALGPLPSSDSICSIGIFMIFAI